MIKDLGLHGTIGPVEFYSYVSGAAAKSAYFYEETPWDIRFFARGNEFIITEEGIRFNGTGGNFCEYMFGVEKPLKDLVKKEVLNRLIMFGALYGKNEKVIFTNNTTGVDSFQRLFLLGNAVRNYFFFVCRDYKGYVKDRQMEILWAVGKLLKRTEFVGEDDDPSLMEAFLEDLAEPESTVLIFKILHVGNDEYYRKYKEFYFNDRKISPEEEAVLAGIAEKYGIDHYQQERMKIDIMYRHPEQKTIVDEYRDILIAGADKDTLKRSELARLRRLRTLRIRNNIPSVLFEALDEFLLKGKKILEAEEPEYLKESREILEGLFFKDPTLKSHIIREDIVRLIRAKHAAYASGDMGLEKILLDVGKACDESARETGDFGLLEEFSSIVTYFDRYDHVQASVSQIAFVEDTAFGEDFLRSVLGNMKEFDELERGLFYDIFIRPLLNNKYITNYGRKKVKTAFVGLEKVSRGDASLREVVDSLKAIVEEEKLYHRALSVLKGMVRGYYSRLDIREVREGLKREAEIELAHNGSSGGVPDSVYERVFLDLKKESFYINSLLPAIIKKVDTGLREDFLKNSGLDRFYIETLEKEYFAANGLDTFLLNLIREDTAKGGE